MGYVVDIKLRDTEIQCANENEMNDKFAEVIQEFQHLGIPDENMIITKENHITCNLGHTHNEVLEQFPENQEP